MRNYISKIDIPTTTFYKLKRGLFRAPCIDPNEGDLIN